MTPGTASSCDLRDSNSAGAPDVQLVFGLPGWKAVAGTLAYAALEGASLAVLIVHEFVTD